MFPSHKPIDDSQLLTSHDVVSRVRRWSGQRRIGHTGTLDPMASGVLVLCLGRATRLVEYYQGATKQYYAEIVLGAATDTYDAVGAIVDRRPLPSLDEACLEAALDLFRGEIQQRPPVYSAIKQGGESLHRKARRGEEVVVHARPVTFYRIERLAWPTQQRIALRIVSSAGAYIRSLAHDLGVALGTYAYLDVLRREAVGSFTLGQAHTLAAIEHAAQQGSLADLLLPPGAGLPLPAVQVGEDLLRRFGFGQVVHLGFEQERDVDNLAQVRTPDGALAGIIRCLGPATDGSPNWLWKAEKWLL